MSSNLEHKEASVTGTIVVDAELKVCLDERGLEMDSKGFVRWRNDNPRHPRNWTGRAKAYNTVVVLLLEFVTTVVGSSGTSAAQEMQDDFDIDLSLSLFCLTSTYLIGQGVGGFFFPPYSEISGRKPLYIASTLVYAVFSIVTASSRSLSAVIIARFLSGLASAVPTIVVAGSIEDVFNVRARIWMIFAWATVGNIGLCVGPIYSSYTTQNLGWRWVFYIPAIVLGALLIICFTLKETRPSLLLQREAAIVRQLRPSSDIQILNPDAAYGFKALVKVTLVRPFRLVLTEPIVTVVAFMESVISALFYMQAESIPLVFEAYGWSTAKASLGFIPVLLGCLATFAVRFVDRRKLFCILRSGHRAEPEDKLTGFAIAAPLLTVGLWVFAWTIPPATKVHWIVPMLAQFFIGFALNENVYALMGYLADSYTIYAASSFSGVILARTSTCAIIVLFTRSMYMDLGYNIATSVLAAVATAFCVVPVIFIKYGKKLREASPFAKFSLAVYDENKVEDDIGSSLASTDEA